MDWCLLTFAVALTAVIVIDCCITAAEGGF